MRQISIISVLQVFPPAKAIFAGVAVLLLVRILLRSMWDYIVTQVSQVAKDVGARQEILISLFSRVEYYFKRLEIYTSVPATAAMKSIIVDIMVEVISFLAIATKEVKQGRTSELINLGIISVLD